MLDHSTPPEVLFGTTYEKHKIEAAGTSAEKLVIEAVDGQGVR